MGVEKQGEAAWTPEAALKEVRRRLKRKYESDGRNQDQLASAAGYERPAVNQAMSMNARPPSGKLVAALARALRFSKSDIDEMLELLAFAREGLKNPPPQGREPRHREGGVALLGRLITEWDPLDLEVHPAAPSTETPGGTRAQYGKLPAYIPRPHDDVLTALVTEAQEGNSRMGVLVGWSSTGKTRACWEAVQPLASDGWRLWHPTGPSRVDAALAGLEHVTPRTVVWLNDAQHILGPDQNKGERTAAALTELLRDETRAPILILGTLWPVHAESLTQMPRTTGVAPYPQARALLSHRRIDVPDQFDARALDQARKRAEAGDRQWADVLRRAPQGRIAQDFAGCLELVHRYRELARPAQAVLDAAMDARRMGLGPEASRSFLADSCTGYLDAAQHDALTDDWFQLALTEAGRPQRGDLIPLRERRPAQDWQGSVSEEPVDRSYCLADYLEEYGRRERRAIMPPATFWQAGLRHGSPQGCEALGRHAVARGLFKHAAVLFRKAVRAGSPTAAVLFVRALPASGGSRRQAASWSVPFLELSDCLALSHVLRQFYKVEAHDAVDSLAARIRSEATELTDPALLLGELRMVGADEAADAVAQRTFTAVDSNDTAAVAGLLDRLISFRAADDAATLATMVPIGELSLAKPRHVANMLSQLLRLPAAREVADAFLARIAETEVDTGDDTYGVVMLLDQLRTCGESDLARDLAHRVSVSEKWPVSPFSLGELVRALQKADAPDTAADVIAGIPCMRLEMSKPSSTLHLVHRLRESGNEDVADRVMLSAARLAAATGRNLVEDLQRDYRLRDLAVVLAAFPETQLQHPDQAMIDRLQDLLRDMGEDHAAQRLEHQAAEYSKTDPKRKSDRSTSLPAMSGKRTLESTASNGPKQQAGQPDTPGGPKADGQSTRTFVELLHDSPLHEEERTAALMVPSAELADLSDPKSLADLARTLHDRHMEKALQALLTCALEVRVSSGDYRGMLELIESLDRIGALEAARALAERTAASLDIRSVRQVRYLLQGARFVEIPYLTAAILSRNPADLTDPDGEDICTLVRELREIEGSEAPQATTLAQRVAARVDIQDPLAVVMALEAAQAAHASDVVAAILRRDPAVHVQLGHPATGRVLELLHEAGDTESVSVLLHRDPAAHVDHSDRHEVTHWVRLLISVGAREDAEALTHRGADAGAVLSPELMPNGREIDGSTAVAWTWDDVARIEEAATTSASLSGQKTCSG
ncbi:hypothetical protein ACWGDT_30860 [Streptomyces avermitilis]